MTNNLIHSKDIYFIMRDVLKTLDPRIINHGSRTAYILYKMLQCTNGKYEMFEIADFCMLATFHDVGAYKTDPNGDMLRYESKECMPHSIYGYLFILYLTPMKDKAMILLHHHTDFEKLKKDNEYYDITCCLNVAEKMDIYSNTLGSKFDYMMFQKQSGTKYSPKALELLYQAEKKYGIFEKINSGEYKKELDELFDYMIFSNEEKLGNLQGLFYSVGMRSEYTMVDMITCVNICRQLADKLLLTKDETQKLCFAATLHDCGMVSVPIEILEAPRKLTDEEIKLLREHVNVAEKILKGRIPDDCLDIVLSHHERGDGSGYPRKLRAVEMNKLQQILHVADTVTGLTAPRSYREPRNKDQVIRILKEESDYGKLNGEVVRTFINFYDKIMENVEKENKEMLSLYNKMKMNYEITYKQIVK